MSEAAEAPAPASSGVTEESLRQTITDKLEAEHIEIVDISGTASAEHLYGAR